MNALAALGCQRIFYFVHVCKGLQFARLQVGSYFLL